MEINYNFYYWGPFLFKTKLSKDNLKKILSFCKKEKSKLYTKYLAGHIKQEYELKTKDVMPILEPYFEAYMQAASEHWNFKHSKKLKMTSSWVNFMKQGEFNPPHVHQERKGLEDIFTLSCVLYLQIPKDMSKYHETNSYPPGSIEFVYGEALPKCRHGNVFTPEVGDFFIFPGWLKHYVCPFYTKGERISLSANLTMVEE